MSTPDLDDPSLAVYRETVELLQREVERLEEELAARPANPGAEAVSSIDPEVEERLAGLRDDLGVALAAVEERDQSITWLEEQIRLLEEAARARDAEFEHLEQWLSELEQRVGDAPATTSTDTRLPAAEAAVAGLEAERQAWLRERAELLNSVDSLESQLARQAEQSPSKAAGNLQAENKRLRQIGQEMAHKIAQSEREVAQQTATLRAEAERLQRELAEREDLLQRTSRSHEAELASLQAQLAQALAERQLSRNSMSDSSAGPSADDRVAALRSHLREIHEREDHERQEKRLSARIARLWGQTRGRPIAP